MNELLATVYFVKLFAIEIYSIHLYFCVCIPFILNLNLIVYIDKIKYLSIDLNSLRTITWSVRR